MAIRESKTIFKSAILHLRLRSFLLNGLFFLSYILKVFAVLCLLQCWQQWWVPWHPFLTAPVASSQWIFGHDSGRTLPVWNCLLLGGNYLINFKHSTVFILISDINVKFRQHVFFLSSLPFHQSLWFEIWSFNQCDFLVRVYNFY